jgi:hypothetical protein
MTRRTLAALAAVTVMVLMAFAVSCSGSGDGDGAADTEDVPSDLASSDPAERGTIPAPDLDLSSQPSGTMPENAQTGPNAPPIGSFTAPPSVTCAAGAQTRVPVQFRTEKAMTVAFLVDMRQVEGLPPLSGGFDVPVPCDGAAHTIILVAVGPDMSTGTKSVAVVAGG